MGLARGRTPRWPGIAAACVFASLAFAQTASANDYCVFQAAADCPAGADQTSGADLQSALTAAGANPGLDTITIGPGDFTAPALGWSYSDTDGDANSDTVAVAGSGAGTHLVPDVTTAGTMFSMAGVTSVATLTLTVPTLGIGFDVPSGSTLDRVIVGAAPASAHSLGVSAAGGATLTHVDIALGDQADSVGLLADTGSTPTQILDSTVAAAQTAVSANGSTALDIRRSSLSGVYGIDAFDADVAAIDTVIAKTAAGGYPIQMTADDAGDHSLDAANLTVVDQSSSSSDAAIQATDSGAGTIPVDVQASLFSGFDEILDQTGGGTASLDQNERYTTLPGTPDFVDGAAGNFHLKATSGLIDRVANLAGTDRDGNPRTVDVLGRATDRDIGAFEFQPHAPTVSLSPSTTSPAAGQSVTFTATAADPDAGDQLSYVWSFDGGPTASGGPSESRSFSAPGPHTATVTVIDLSRRSASDNAVVTVPTPAPPTPHSPTVGLTASNNSPAPGETVTFTATASDPDAGDQLTFLWSFDGGPTSESDSTEDRSFSAPGSHTATVTVIDQTSRSASANAVVTVPAPPAEPPPATTPVETPQQPAAQSFRAGTCINLFNGTSASDTLNGSPFGDAISGLAGNDTLNGLGGEDCILGDEGNDRISGGDGNDDLRGQAGNDRLKGDAGDDTLVGGPGNDRLDGGAGNDTLDGGAGRNTLIGGAGNDVIKAADGRAEGINCGPGRDRVSADPKDRLRGCEKVKRTRH